jgi:hypothetical protein
VHYRVGWLVERLNYLESVHLLRQGLDVRLLSAERPARRRRDEKSDAAQVMEAGSDEAGEVDEDEEEEAEEPGVVESPDAG